MNNAAVTQDRRATRLDELAALVQARIGAEQRTLIESFVRRYYGQVDVDDLADRDLADLYGASLSHFAFARKREPGRAKVRAFNPTIEEHGWQSTHTVIEVVNDDMPFLVDSVSMEANRHGLTLHLIVHPILDVARAADGTIVAVGEAGPEARRESFIHAEVDRVSGATALAQIAQDVERVLADLRFAVADWAKMRERALDIVREIDANPPALPAAEVAEGRDFLAWLADNHFTFLGYRRHDLVSADGQDALKVVPGSSLGILRMTEPASLSLIHI